MFNIKKLILSSSIIATSLLASSELTQKQLKEFEELELLKNLNVKVEKGLDADSLYILDVKIRNSMDTIYITKDKKYLISGDVINTQSGKSLEMPLDMSILEGKETLNFGTGKDEYILFTDPECPYCKKFESYFPQIKDKVNIKVFYYPLSHHTKAYDISLNIMAQKTNADKIDAMLNKNYKSKINKKDKKELQEKLDEQIQLANKLGVRGTPNVFDKEGNKVSWVNILSKYGIELK